MKILYIILNNLKGAMTISVEHRFYGETQPFNDTSTEHLVYLTTPQAYVLKNIFVQQKNIEKDF